MTEGGEEEGLGGKRGDDYFLNIGPEIDGVENGEEGNDDGADCLEQGATTAY